MNIVLLGLNHKTAPIELRERLAIGPLQLEDATRSLMQAPGVLEGMILSTCNRVELLTSQEANAPDLLEFVGSYFAFVPSGVQPRFDGDRGAADFGPGEEQLPGGALGGSDPGTSG